jgi:phenylalanyl-tRNA synthetase alpha chain
MTYEEFSRNIATLRFETEERIRTATSMADVHEIRRQTVGRKGELKNLQRSIGSFSAKEKPLVGRLVQDATSHIESLLEATLLRVTGDHHRSLDPLFDPTIPGASALDGGLHPIVQMMYDINDAFRSLNFDIYAGPEISSELYEFDNMNFPPEHPARESMDTYWLTNTYDRKGAERLCLRPHLTGASVRYMQTHEPPHRFAYPGRVYRNESADARHERAFYQFEALITDRELPFSAGKLLVSTILSSVFGRDVRVRMRAGYFPFVEPGFEIDMECQVCHGKGCRLCRGVGWLEIMPGGIPHPNVMRAGGLDPDEWTGFYIDIGLDRLVMMRYGIDDIRLFNGADLRFLGQFK